MSRTPVPRHKSDGSHVFFVRTVGEIQESKWRDLLDEQDYDTLIFEIREDILNHVSEECYRKYLKKEVYKFLIECTHRALQQLVPLHFYAYDDSHKYSSSQESWIADDEPLICKPDSWAKGNIPYNVEDIPKSKFQQTVSVSSDYQIVKCDEYPSSHVFDTISYTYNSVGGENFDLVMEKSRSFDDDAPGTTEDFGLISQSSVQFNDANYDTRISIDMNPSLQDISAQPNRIASENTFYKIMKVNKTSSISLPTSMKGRKLNLPAWTTIDEVRDEPKTRAFGPNRYLQMRRECLATIDRSKPMSKK